MEAEQEKRFWAKVDKSGSCWLWNGYTNADGYGQWRPKAEKRMRLAHRISFTLTNGRPPKDGLVLDHICRVRHCVNPGHLREVTNRENILCGISPVAVNARRIACANGHPLESDNLLIRQDNRGEYRRCRACHLARKREWAKRDNAQKTMKKLPGKWMDNGKWWKCFCQSLSSKMLPMAKACAFCYAQRPRKGFGGERPPQPHCKTQPAAQPSAENKPTPPDYGDGGRVYGIEPDDHLERRKKP